MKVFALSISDFRIFLLLVCIYSFSLNTAAQSVVHVSDASGTNATTCGGSASPCATIQYAADNIATDGDTIKIDTGLYQLATSVNQYIPVVKLPEGKSLSFIGTASGLGTRIDGDTTRRGFLYYYAGTGCNSGDTNDGVSDSVHLYFQDIIIQNCHIKETCGSTSYAYGGGMRLDCDSSSTMHIDINQCIFRDNRSLDVPGTYAGGRSGSGGAIWIYGRRNPNTTGPSNYAEAFIRNCDFSGNYANQYYNGGHGGAVLLRDLDTAAVSNSSFCDNYVFSQNADNGDLLHDRNAGGAICVYDLTNFSPGHAYHIDSCTFINNSATVAANLTNPSEGGAIFLTKGDVLSATTTATLHLSNTDFYNNNVEAGIEHYDKNGGTIDTSSVGFNAYYTQFQVGLGNDTAICTGDTLFLDATIVGAEYLWHDGYTGPIYNVTASDTYMVTVTVGSCEVSDTIIVTVSDYPIVDLGNDTTLCPYDSLLLSALWSSSTYDWSTGSNDSAIMIFGAGTYWVEVDAMNCISSDTIVIDTVSLAAVQLGPDTHLCDNATLLLNATQTGANYAWQNSTTNSSFLVSNAGSYAVTVSIGGCALSDTIFVTYGTSPSVNLGVDQTLCPYDSIVLDASASPGSYLWNTGATSSSIVSYGEGQYWVSVDSLGCVGSDTIIVDTVILAPVNLGPDTQLCDVQTMLLDASQSGASYLWNNGSTNPSQLVTNAGNYAVTVSKSSCSYSDQIQVTYQSFPIVNIGPDTTICPYDDLFLDATNAGALYVWSTGSTGSGISISEEATYSVAVNLNGCWAFDTIMVDTVIIPATYLGDNQLRCPGDMFSLDATTNNATAYSWHDGSTNAVFNGSSGGIHWVDVTVDFCHVTDSVNIHYVQAPIDIIGGDKSVCEDQTVEISVGPSGLSNYLWNTGSNQQTITANSGGQYWVSVTKLGCPFADTIQVEFRPLPVVQIDPNYEACDGDTVFLDATNPNAIYAWNDGYDVPIRAVRKSGIYSVSVYMDGCFTEATTEVLFKPNPVPELPATLAACEGKSRVLRAYRSFFDSYSWNTGSIDSAINVFDDGTYAVTVSMDGCYGSDSAVFKTHPKPEIELGNDSILCEGDLLTLSAKVEGDAVYEWQNGSDDSQLEVWRPGDYSVKVNRKGCISKDSVSFDYKYYPKLNIGNDTVLCIGDSLMLSTDDSNSVFTWNGTEVQDSYVINDSAYVYVEGTSYCGNIRDSITVTVRDCECFMYVPLAFTPDADDINETFKPQFDCDLTNYHIRVFDRWGHVIFESSDPNIGWNGTLQNIPVKIGVYGFEVEYKAQLKVNGSNVQFYKTGIVNVVR